MTSVLRGVELAFLGPTCSTLLDQLETGRIQEQVCTFPNHKQPFLPQGRIPLSTSLALMSHWRPPLEPHLLEDASSEVGV